MASICKAFFGLHIRKWFVLFLFLFLNKTAFAQPDTIRYTGSPAFCQGGSLVLTTNPTGSSYTWQLNGTTVSTTSSYTATQSGTVTVTVNGRLYTSLSIVVNPLPVVSFTADNSGSCSGTTINFVSTVTSGTAPFSYLWNFADGTTSTTQNPSQPLTILGCGATPTNVNNRLTVSDANACTANIINPQSILRAPDVQLSDSNTFSPFRNCDNNPTPANPNYRLKVANASPSASCVSTYSIDWGDGIVQTGITATSFPLIHVYTQLGAFNLVFTGLGTNGCSYSKTYVVANQSNPAGGLGTLGATTGLCTPANIPFVISNWQLNSPGTTYVVDYGDGTNVTLTHPLNNADTPHRVNHIYTTTSCPGSPTFTATLLAKNACATTPYTAGNLQVRIKPTPNFTYPNPGCAGQSINFTNTTAAGYYGATCSTAAQYNWDFGDAASGANNTSTSTNPSHNFSSPGTYTITLSANNPCGTASVTKQICIVAPAVPTFTLNNLTGCTPVTVNATNTSNTLTACAAPVYNWVVSYTASNCGTATTPPFTYINGTNANSVNPSFLFTNPGTYSIRLSITNPCGTVQSAAQTVSVKRPPTVALPNYSNVCGPVTITPTATIATCGGTVQSYEWTFAGGTPATFTGANPGPVSFSSLGTSGITLAVTNECGTTTVSKQFTISSTPDVTVPSNQAFCKGTTAGPFTFSSSVTGTSFTWTNSNTAIGLAANGTGNIAGFTAANATANPITATITVTPVNGCSGPPATFTITVNPIPAAPVVAAVNYCQNDTPVPLTATATGSNTLNWYAAATGGTASNTAPTPVTTSAGTTSYYVSQTGAGGCESPRATIAVTVNPSFTIGNATTTNPSSCGSATGSITISGLTASVAYTVTYTKNGNPVTVNISTNGSGNLVINGLTSGTYDNIKVARAGCPSNAIGPYSLSDPNPPATPAANGNSPLCSGGTISLTASTTATGAVTYNWSGPGFSSNSQNPTIPNATVAATGTYSVTVTVAGCTSPAATVAVVVNPTPTNTTGSSNSPICGGDTVRLLANSATTGVTYSWTGPNGFTSNQQNPEIVNATVAASGTYTVVATLGNCSAAPRNVPVTVNAKPIVTDSSFVNPSTCTSASGSISLLGLANNVGYTVRYLKNGVPVTVILFSNGSGVLTISNLTPGTYTNITITASGCTSNAVGPFVLVAPNPPATPVAGSNSPICAGTSLNLTATTTTSGTVSYNWTGPGGFTSNQQNPVIPNATAAASGTYTVTATVNGCISPAATVSVIVAAGISNNSISSNQTICINTAPGLLSGSNPAGGGGAISYVWEQSTDNGITWTIIPGATGQDYQPGIISLPTRFRRNVSTTLCSGSQGNISNVVTVSLNPDAVAQFSPTATVGCVPFNITPAIINLTPYNNAVSTYNWYVNGTLIGSGQTFPGYTIINPGDSITIKLVAISRFGCRNDSMQRGFKTIVQPVPAFTQSDSVGCGPLSIAFTNNTPNATQYTYFWNFGNGVTSTQQQPGPVIFPPNPLSGDTVYTVRFITISQCSRDTLLRYVRVKSKPKALFAPDRTNGCSSYNFTFTNTSRGNGNSYVWDFGDGSPTLATNATTVQHIYHTGITDTFRVKLKATNECGTDSLVYKLVVQSITIRPDFAINGNERYGCLPHTVRFFNNSQGGSAFYWDFGDGGTLNTSANSDTVTHTYYGAGTYTVRLRATNNCSDTTDTELITVYPKPAVAFTATPLVACFGDTIRTVNTSDTGLVYNWRFGDGGTSLLRNPVYVYASGGTYRIGLRGTKAYPSGIGCADSAFADVLIRDTLAGQFTASDTTAGCLPATITFKNSNRPATLTTWTFGDGGTAIGDSVTHTYVQPGSYTVKMISKGLAGCTYTFNKTITITSPAGTLQYSSGYLCPGIPLRMQVTANAATQQIRYVFGDGDSLTTTSPLIFHTYLQPGIYIPYAYAISGSCRTRLTVGDTVRVDGLRTGFRTVQQPRCGATSVSFTDTSFAYFGIQSRRYDFGDGTFSTLQNPVKTYQQSGTYNVQLRIVGNSGCADTITIPVTVVVRSSPVSTISGDSIACIGQPITYTALVQSADAIAGYNWNFGNGVTGSGATITATYNQPGSFTIRLISRTGFGCADTVYKTIGVRPSPVVNAGSDVRICRGNSVQLGATGAATWQWSPLQNLSCTTCPNPVANPLFTTSYIVTGNNNLLCKASDTIVVEVVQPFNLTVTPATTLCIGDSIQLSAVGAYTYAWSPATGLDNPALSNPIAKPAITTLYQVVGKDRYNCFTDTDYVRVNVGRYPTVDLGTGGTVTAGTVINMNPIIINGPIARYRWTPVTDLSCSNCPRPTAVINNNIVYKLEVENNFGCTGSDTIIYRVNCTRDQLFVPTAFSPDGDGTNDVLMVRGRGIATVKYFRVFNRWGQLVFERSNINANDPQQGWNGTVNGRFAEPEVYVWTVEALCTGGATFVEKGNVTLVR